MLDDRTAARAPTGGEREHFVWSYATNRTAWRMYLGTEPGGADIPAYHAPARNADFAGLPPAYIGIGALDLFLDENLDYARRLAKAGVGVTLQVFPGAFHGFERHPTAPVACRIRAEAERALTEAFRKEG
jgi:triacylglycerol lipase